MSRPDNAVAPVAVVTGAARGIGLAIAERFLAEGHRVALLDIDGRTLRSTEKRLHDPRRVLALVCDVSDPKQVKPAVRSVARRFGRIDALVNNAYPRNAHYGRPFDKVEYADFAENVSTHAGGYFLAAQRFIAHFQRQGHGNIVNMSSIYGVVAPRFEVYAGTDMTMPVEYAVIKSGILHLTRYIASWCAGMNIRCNSISPGGIAAGQPQAFLDRYKEHALSKGMLDAQDVAGTLLFLLSDLSSYMNGQNIVVDDGWTL